MPKSRNTLVRHVSPDNFFDREWISVESITDEGAPFSFAVIYHNKHGRSNLHGVGRNFGRFMAGSGSRRSIEKYARHVDPNSYAKVFIDSGRIRHID